MKKAMQRQFVPCTDCGGTLHVKPTRSPFEFDYHCTECTRAGTISWSHKLPPPVYEKPERKK